MRPRVQYGLTEDDMMAAHAIACELDRLPYICRRILMIDDTLMQLEMLRMSVSSPRIKSVDEAAYQQSIPYTENSRAVEMWLRSCELQAEMDGLIEDWHRIARRLQILTDEELDLIQMRFEESRSYESIGIITGWSRESVRRHINMALLRMSRARVTG